MCVVFIYKSYLLFAYCLKYAESSEFTVKLIPLRLGNS